MNLRNLLLGAALLASAAGAAACTAGADAPTASPAAHDGEAVFRGLFYGEGPVAARLPELTRGAPRRLETPQAARVREGVLARLRAQDPAFLDRFAAAVQSGSHLRVARALDEARTRVDAALREEQASLGVAVKAASDEDIVVPSEPVYFIWVYDYLNIYPVIGTGIANVSASTGLERDAVVDLVARRLGA